MNKENWKIGVATGAVKLAGSRGIMGIEVGGGGGSGANVRGQCSVGGFNLILFVFSNFRVGECDREAYFSLLALK